MTHSAQVLNNLPCLLVNVHRAAVLLVTTVITAVLEVLVIIFLDVHSVIHVTAAAGLVVKGTCDLDVVESCIFTI